jgi:hypothetical protein
MSTANISAVLTDLFSAPLKAAVDAESKYRQAWADWLTFQMAILTKEDGKTLREGVKLEEVLRTAPVVSLDGTIELAISMRIAAVKELSAGLGVSVGVGPVYASGNFGFMSRTTEESTFQAQAKFTLSNTQKNLTSLLEQSKLTPTDPATLNTAIQELGKYMTKPEITNGAVVKGNANKPA